MAKFLVVLLQTVKAFYWASFAFGAYAWLWLPRFQRGSVGGPYWLLTSYERLMPLLLGIGVVGFVAVWLFQGLAGVLGQKPSPNSQQFRGAFWWLAAVALIGGIPGFLAQYTYLNGADFDGGHYHLIQRTSGNTANYFIFNCTDPVGFWCQKVLVTEPFPAPPPTPTPLPEVIELVDEQTGEIIQFNPPLLPTSTPPALLLTDSSGELELSIQVGGLRAPVATAVPPTPTPSP